MARIRQIKPEFFKSEDVASLEPMTRLLFIGLWTLADREGRLLDRPRRIAIELFPYDRLEDQIDLMLGSLTAKGLLARYVANDVACIQVTGFARHQKPHKDEPVGLPGPPELNQPLTGESSHNVGQNREKTGQVLKLHPTSSACSGSLGSGSLGSSISSEAVKPPSKPILTFPTVGKDPTWELTEVQLAEWSALFPSLDLLGECRKALAWTLANPSRKKTTRGMPAFLVGWFGRSQNRGPQSPQPSGPFYPKIRAAK